MQDTESTLRLQWETCLGLGSAAVADVTIAASMCYYLYKKRTGLRRSVGAVFLLADDWDAILTWLDGGSSGGAVIGPTPSSRS